MGKTTAGRMLRPAQHCLDLVKRCDKSQFLCALLAPARSRDAQLALRAFNIETASIADRVKDPRIGTLRINFWRSMIDQMFKKVEADDDCPPVMAELRRAHEQHRFTRRWFDKFLDAREKDLSQQPQTVEQLEEFSEATGSALLYLTLEAQGVRDVQADHAASHIGKALAISTVLRATPHHATNNQVYIPVQLLRQHKVDLRQLLAQKTSDALQDAVLELASVAKGHLDHARTLPIPPAANSALLPAAICDQYLDALQQHDFDLFQPALQQPSQLSLQWTLGKNSLFTRF